MQLADDLAKDIYDAQKMPGKLPAALIDGYAKKFLEALNKNFSTEANGVPDAEQQAVINDLRLNVYQFAAAKSYTQLKALTEAILDDAGKVRSWSEFKTAAYQINNEHVVTWLRAEYDNAVVASQMAGKWVTIQSTKKTLPLLKFIAVMDGHTTYTCRTLNGTVLPADHPFWQKYYLPNHWGERSDIIQLASGDITPESDIPSATLQPMFETNLAEKGMLFPPKHPYFVNAPESVIKQGTNAFKTAFKGK